MLPVIKLHGEGALWRPRHDLLNSGRFAPEFVVEMEEDGRATLRFGDDALGRRPVEGTTFRASYRIGLLYTSEAADDLLCVDLVGRRIIKNKSH